MDKTIKRKGIFFLKRKKRILPSILMATALPFLLFMAVPFDIYCHNISEFEFAVGNFALFCFLFFLAFSLINFSILFFTPRVVYRVYSAILVATLFMSFIQMTFLNGSISSLTGDGLGNTIKTSTIVINTIIWVLAEAGLIVGFLLIPNRDVIRLISIAVAIVIIITQVVSIVSLTISTDGFGKSSLYRLKEEDPNFEPTFLTTKDLTTISTDRNVFVFCIDRMDGMDYAEPALENHPEIFNQLDGFTYFNDNLSLYGHTYPSVCYMVTGEEYNGEYRKDYFDNAYGNNKTISKLHEKGYMINLFTDSYHGYYNAYYLPDYINNTETASLDSISFENKTAPYSLSARMAQISLFRCLPYLIKGLPGSVSSSALNGEVEYFSEELSNPETSTDMKLLYEKVDDTNANKFKTTDQKVFSFIHLSGCHNVEYDENFNKARNVSDINVSIRNSFKIINKYIKALKQAGVYDEATIIITADHGNATAASDTTKLKDQRLSALFVKPSSRTADYDSHKNVTKNICSTPVSHEDLWATIFESEGLDSFKKENTNSVFYYKDNMALNANRERKFVWHTWNLTASKSSEYIYQINGSARTFDNWTIKAQKELGRYLFD